MKNKLHNRKPNCFGKLPRLEARQRSSYAPKMVRAYPAHRLLALPDDSNLAVLNDHAGGGAETNIVQLPDRSCTWVPLQLPKLPLVEVHHGAASFPR